MTQFNVNSDGVNKLTKKLKQLHKSALPSAIRNTLNDAAFDMKTKTMPESADKIFIKRSKNFFKANSKFEKANGFDIKKMKSTVGFFENKLQNKSTNYAVKDLEEQENGGNINGRSAVPMKQARSGGNGLVKPNSRINFIQQQMRKLPNASKSKVSKRFLKQRFIRAAIVARELNPNNSFMLGNYHSGSQTLFRVDYLSTATRGQGSFGSRKLQIKLIPLYRVRKNRVFNARPHHFLKRASLGTALKIEKFYIEQAKRQLKKYLHT